MDGSLPILKELGIEQSMEILGKAFYEIFLGKALAGHGNVPKVLKCARRTLLAEMHDILFWRRAGGKCEMPRI